MKKSLVLFALIAVVLSGAVGVLLVKQLRAERARARAAAAAAEAAAAAREEREQRLAEVERDRAHVEAQNAELLNLAKTLRQSESKSASNIAALVKRLNPASTNNGAQASLDGAGEPNQGMGSMLQKMMKDPAMKEMIRNQQKTMMKSMYGPLFKDLNLPADQQKQLTDLLLDVQMSLTDSAGDMFSADGAIKTNAIAEITARQQASQEQVKALIGEEKYTVYEDYQKSMGDRMVLNQFQQQSDGTDTALRDEQMKQLVQVMKEERTRIPPVFSNDPSKAGESFSKMMNAELMDQQFKWQEDFSKRVSDRAGQILSPEQLKEFSDFQSQQVNMQKLGLKMAREMFKPGAGANPTPTP